MSQHPTQAFSEHTEMKRDLGLLEAVSGFVDSEFRP